MTKLEELTALLVNEINDFNQGVEKLDEINNQLKTLKIKMDVTEYKSIIETHEQKMESFTKVIERFEKKIKQAKIYPTWAVMVFVLSLLFCVGAIILQLLKV